MDNDLKVVGLQLDLIWEDPTRNLQEILSQLSKIKNADLVVLPETFSTGFSLNAINSAYNTDSPDLALLQEWTNKNDIALCGSVWFKEEGNLTNRLLWISPHEQIQHYDKRHLFSLSDEPKVMKPGNRRLIIEYKGWRIAPLICYDLRFPVWSKNTAEYQYDILIYVANWPERRTYAWEHLLIARAIENQSYVVGVNRVGMDGNQVNHIGASAIINPLGEIIVRAKDNSPQAIRGSLSKIELNTYRDKLPFLADGDKFSFED